MTDRHRIYLTVATMVASLVAVVLSAIVAPVARAQEPEPFTYRWYKRDLYWKQYMCGGDYHPEGCARWRRWRRWQWRQQAPGSSVDKHGCLLRQTVHVWSGQHNTEDAARGDAQKRWMIATQSEHGSVYMNFTLAAGVTWRCFQSQAHDTLTGKVTAGIGKYVLGGEGYYQVCELWATPCSAPLVGKKDDGK